MSFYEKLAAALDPLFDEISDDNLLKEPAAEAPGLGRAMIVPKETTVEIRVKQIRAAHRP